MFKTKKEFALAMLDGRKFIAKFGDLCLYDPSFVYPFRCGRVELLESWNEYNNITEILPWYNNIPEKGMLCWIWDNHKRNLVGIIAEYRDGYYITVGGTAWKNAVPLTKAEIEEITL